MRTFTLLMLLISFLLISSATLAQDNTLPEAFPGQLAIISADRNVHVIHDAGRTALTTDAQTQRAYQWTTWSTDGRLAYFCCELESVGIEVYISQNGDAPGKMVYDAMDKGFTYAYWAPANCPDGETCRDLAVLMTQIGQPNFVVTAIRDNGADSSSRSLGFGAPFYFSWSPDASQMIWQRNNLRFDLYEVSTDAAQELDEVPGAAVPMWSPGANADSFAIGSLDLGVMATDILVIEGEESRVLQADVNGQLALSWSPDGRYLAYTVIRDGLAVLNVIDAQTGETISASRPDTIVAYFWSPDSRQIAYVSLSDSNSQGISAQQHPVIQLKWTLLDVTSGTTKALTAFTPTDEMTYMLAFFAQFAQSHRLWSPDSRYLTFGELTGDKKSVVTILDTQADRPIRYQAAEGYIGIWSFE